MVRSNNMKKILIILTVLFGLIGSAYAGCVTRYFVLPAENVNGYKASLFTDNDLLPLSNLKVIPGPVLADGRQIVKAELPGYLIKTMKEHCADFGIDDPLTPEGVTALGIIGSFAGRTRAEVLFRWPELVGQVQAGVDEEGSPVMVDKMPRMRWVCE